MSSFKRKIDLQIIDQLLLKTLYSDKLIEISFPLQSKANLPYFFDFYRNNQTISVVEVPLRSLYLAFIYLSNPLHCVRKASPLLMRAQ